MALKPSKSKREGASKDWQGWRSAMVDTMVRAATAGPLARCDGPAARPRLVRRVVSCHVVHRGQCIERGELCDFPSNVRVRCTAERRVERMDAGAGVLDTGTRRRRSAPARARSTPIVGGGCSRLSEVAARSNAYPAQTDKTGNQQALRKLAARPKCRAVCGDQTDNVTALRPVSCLFETMLGNSSATPPVPAMHG